MYKPRTPLADRDQRPSGSQRPVMSTPPSRAAQSRLGNRDTQNSSNGSNSGPALVTPPPKVAAGHSQVTPEGPAARRPPQPRRPAGVPSTPTQTPGKPPRTPAAARTPSISRASATLDNPITTPPPPAAPRAAFATKAGISSRLGMPSRGSPARPAPSKQVPVPRPTPSGTSGVPAGKGKIPSPFAPDRTKAKPGSAVPSSKSRLSHASTPPLSKAPVPRTPASGSRLSAGTTAQKSPAPASAGIPPPARAAASSDKGAPRVGKPTPTSSRMPPRAPSQPGSQLAGSSLGTRSPKPPTPASVRALKGSTRPATPPVRTPMARTPQSSTGKAVEPSAAPQRPKVPVLALPPRNLDSQDTSIAPMLQAAADDRTWLDGRASLAMRSLPEPPKLPNETAHHQVKGQAAGRNPRTSSKPASPAAARSPAATPSPLKAKRSGSLTSKLALLAIPEDSQAAGDTIPAASSPSGHQPGDGDGVSGLIEAKHGSPGVDDGMDEGNWLTGSGRVSIALASLEGRR